MKRVLITAGPVYGKLDDNKIVSNRSRGLWAVEFAKWLLAAHRDAPSWSSKDWYQPILLVPDIMEHEIRQRLGVHVDQVTLRTHNGYDSYRAQCHELAPKVDAAIMAAAVVNWIPEKPFEGKMPTDTDRQLIPFILAPRVINEMKELNPLLTLIGCKLLFTGEVEPLIDAAYHVLLAARCNAVVANDAKLGLRSKYVVHQDRCVQVFDDEFVAFYDHLRGLIDDQHYHTAVIDQPLDLKPEFYNRYVQTSRFFDHIVELFRTAFAPRGDGDFVLGAVAIREPDGRFLVSPREKGRFFSERNAVLVDSIDTEVGLVYTQEGKASLNAPLLIRHLQAYPNARAVVHYHGDWDGWQSKIGCLGVSPKVEPTVDYAPPGTFRDNNRPIPGPSYRIAGHGWIVAVDHEGKPI